MTPELFVKTYREYASKSEYKTGISAVFILAQAALESGWGKHAPGNMFFGVKDTDGINGNEQLLTTTEYARSPNINFKRIIKIVPVTIKGEKYFKYTIKSYFRKYDTPEESFTDHANLFVTKKRYAKAMLVKDNPYKFADEIAKAGYATAISYSITLKKIIKMIETKI